VCAWNPSSARWGRNSEAYSECPFITGQFVQAVMEGYRGSDPRFLRAFGGCKHFVPCKCIKASAHSTHSPHCSTPPHLFTRLHQGLCSPHPLTALLRPTTLVYAVADDGAALTHASDYDLFSTYLPGFAKCIAAGALNLMCSYPTDGNSGDKDAGE
jgi:beta-glucosidase-like glycosyl hydrolase